MNDFAQDVLANVQSKPEEKALHIADVSNNEATDCTCGVPTPDSDNECCVVCGNLIYSEVAASCTSCKWNMAKYKSKCEGCHPVNSNYEQDADC